MRWVPTRAANHEHVQATTAGLRSPPPLPCLPRGAARPPPSSSITDAHTSVLLRHAAGDTAVSQEAAPHTGPLNVFTPFNSPPPSHVWRPLCPPSARTPLRRAVWQPLLPLPHFSLSSRARWRRTPVGDPLALSRAAPPARPCGTSGSARNGQESILAVSGGKDACPHIARLRMRRPHS